MSHINRTKKKKYDKSDQQKNKTKIRKKQKTWRRISYSPNAVPKQIKHPVDIKWEDKRRRFQEYGGGDKGLQWWWRWRRRRTLTRMVEQRRLKYLYSSHVYRDDSSHICHLKQEKKNIILIQIIYWKKNNSTSGDKFFLKILGTRCNIRWFKAFSNSWKRSTNIQKYKWITK